MMEIRTALKCFNKRKCRFLTPCFYVCKRRVSISVKRGFYARKIPVYRNADSPCTSTLDALVFLLNVQLRSAL